MRTVSIPVADGLTLTGDEWGDSTGRPALMLHGAGQNRHAWKRTAQILAGEGWFVVAVDARGHGDSDWSAEEHYDIDHTGADVLELVARFDRRPVVIGASMGGMAALAAQDMHPGQPFEALVLVDIAPGFDFTGASRIIAFMTGNPDGFMTLDEASDVLAAYNPHRPRPKDTSGLTKVLRQGDDGRWHWRWDPKYISSKPGFADGDQEVMRTHMDAMNDRLMRAARDVAGPLLLVRGGQSDLVTHDVAQSFVQQVPGAEFVDVAETGHMVAGDDNDAFTTAVQEFLARRLLTTSKETNA